MTSPTNDPGHAMACARPDLASELIRWDALDFRRRLELEAHARECSACGPALELLRRADAWLEAQGGTSAPKLTAGECPKPDDLYDFGHGPGAQPIASAKRVSIQAHLVACAECRELVASLASRPPVPLYHDSSDVQGATERESAGLDGRERASGIFDLPLGGRVIPARRWLWIPAAAALLLASISLLWKDIWANNGSLAGARASVFPTDEVVRGVDESPLDYPRERVLYDGDHLWSSIQFELAPRERASSYRIQVSRTDGGAFDAGTPLAKFETQSAATTIDAALAQALRPGRYTWEAWALVDGLDVFLGRRDFEVVDDPSLAIELAAANTLRGDERAAKALELLHAKRFETDARAFARTLPPSSERDEYLRRAPRR